MIVVGNLHEKQVYIPYNLTYKKESYITVTVLIMINAVKTDKKVKFKTSIGGQALIEGIMMRGPEKTTLGVRKQDGSIYTEDVASDSGENRKRDGWHKAPLIRGLVNMVDTMKLSVECLNRSVDISGFAEAETTEEPSKFEKWLDKKFGDKVVSVFMGIGMVLGVILAVFLFTWVPAFLFSLIKKAAGDVDISNWRALFEGVLKIIIFIAYIAIVGAQKDIKRVFKYHGAEHKSIFCYEKGLPLTVDNIRVQSRFHPRCGTSFLILMLIVSILITFLFSFFTTLDNTLWLWIPLKILLIPLIVGLGYEIIKWAGKSDCLFVKIISAPGLWVQRLTTKEPDDDQIEVAIEALKSVIPEDGKDHIS